MSKEIKRFFKSEKSKICFFGTYPPRECGIATFTKDLSGTMNKRFNPVLKSRIIAINEDDTVMRNYDNKVVMQITGNDISDYVNLARKVNGAKDVKLVSVQHEFGIFGGKHGNYLIPFLENLEKPAVVTFHSVLPGPDRERKKIVSSIISNSAAVVVMANKAKEILTRDYGASPSKINVIHHGIPDVSFRPSEELKKKTGLEGKTVLSTFGLISSGKGIEYVIKAMPKLTEKYPNLVYLVIGETHPVVREKEGEAYRNNLINLVRELKLENHVKFFNKYLGTQEIINYLLATDVYVCTNLEKSQIVSGTLAYAMGCGKIVISTPTEYAREMLAEKRGLLVKLKDPSSYEKAVNKILSSPKTKKQMERDSYSFSRSMTWSNVALKYLRLFNNIVSLREDTTEKYPKIKLDHLRRMTDDFGMIQFANHSKPDVNWGYSVDDNARALIAAVMHYNLTKSKISLGLINKYLNFIKFTQRDNGRFVNQVQEKGKITEENYSQDSFGRTMWALGYVIAAVNDKKIIAKARETFDKSSSWLEKVNSIRTRAFLINALHYYGMKFRNPANAEIIRKHADFLVSSYETESSKEWQWFEEKLSYSNAKIPESLFFAYLSTKDAKYLEVAEKTFNFLTDVLIIDGELSLIGQNGWYRKNGKRAFFDQQPVDACSMVSACLTAFSVTGNEEYYGNAIISFNWFLGKNYLKEMMYNESTGGCYDGLGKSAVNLNQGAESTLAYLLARLSLEELRKKDGRTSRSR